MIVWIKIMQLWVESFICTADADKLWKNIQRANFAIWFSKTSVIIDNFGTNYQLHSQFSATQINKIFLQSI